MTPSDRFDHITRHSCRKRPVRKIGNLPDPDQLEVPLKTFFGAFLSQRSSRPHWSIPLRGSSMSRSA